MNHFILPSDCSEVLRENLYYIFISIFFILCISPIIRGIDYLTIKSGFGQRERERGRGREKEDERDSPEQRWWPGIIMMVGNGLVGQKYF